MKKFIAIIDMPAVDMTMFTVARKLLLAAK